MGEIVVRFARRLAATGIDDLADITTEACRAFIDAPARTGSPPSLGTRHFRRVTLRAWFRTLRHLGVPVGDPTVDIGLPARNDTSARPLHDAEIILCRETTFSQRARDLRRPAAWALAEATAVTSEIPQLRIRSLDDPHQPWHVTLPGTRRVRPRVVPLTDWGHKILTARLAELGDDPDASLVYEGRRGTDTVAAQAAACSLIGVVLESAGLDDEPEVRPASVRHWRAASDFAAGADIATVTNLLGHNSLDDTAATLRWDWQA
jgi:integrase/recombinase XerC